MKQLLESFYDFDDDENFGIDSNFQTKGERIAKDISKLDPNITLPILRELLFESEEYTRSDIVLILSYIRNPESEKILNNIVMNDKSSEVRSSAALSLGNFSSNETSQSLLIKLCVDESGDVRENAAYSLSTIKPDGWLETFKEVAETETHFGTKFKLNFELAKVEKDNEKYLTVLLDLKKRGVLKEYQNSFIDDLLKENKREEMNEVKDVLSEFLDDDELDDLFG